MSQIFSGSVRLITISICRDCEIQNVFALSVSGLGFVLSKTGFGRTVGKTRFYRSKLVNTISLNNNKTYKTKISYFDLVLPHGQNLPTLISVHINESTIL